jgi:hypothetical protein
MKNEIRNVLSCVICLSTILAFAGCEKKSGQAVIILKEHIPAREKAQSPAKEVANTPKSEPSVRPKKPVINEEEEANRADGTITVDGYVMRPEVRGTGQDPRALSHEQWIVTVRLVDTGRSFRVQTDRAQFAKLNETDLVQVVYRVGKYTKTVWDAEIK